MQKHECVDADRLEEETSDWVSLAVLIYLCAANAVHFQRARRDNAVSYLPAQQEILAGATITITVIY